jgi:hypothetical protein
MRARAISFFCIDCGAGHLTGYTSFMVRSILWYIAVEPHDREKHLCLPCFRKRLGRTMYESDFRACPLNVENAEEIREFLDGKDNIWEKRKTSLSSGV